MKLLSVLFLSFVFSNTYSATYYVAKTGDDNNTGSIGSPWLTLQKGANIAVAGDTVYVKEGTYNERVLFSNSGTATDVIVFTNFLNDAVIIDGNSISWGASWNGLVDLSDVNYIEFSGFTVQNADYTGIWIENASYITVKNCKTYNTFSSGIGVWNSSNITIHNNEVELACNDGEQECITLSQSSFCNVFNNEVHHNGQGTNGGEGIDVKQGSHDINIYKNEVHHLNNRLGIYADAWDMHTYNINIYNNKVHHCSESGIAIASENGGLIENVKVYNNLVYTNKYGGIEIGSWSDIGFQGVMPISDVKIINNTCFNNGNYDSGWGFGIVIDNPNASGVLIQNNICSDNSAQLSVQQINGSAVIENNLIYGNNTASGTLVGNNAILQNPLFIDVSVDDFHLQSTSPAIDNGASLGAPIFDFENNNRPFGASVDIGAYEYSTVTNITSLMTNYIRVYPNPAKDFVKIEVEKNIESLKIYNAIGKLIQQIQLDSAQNKIINTQNWERGLYFIKGVTIKGKKVVTKIIVSD